MQSKLWAVSISFWAPPVAECICTWTGKREVLSSNRKWACRPSRLEFSVVFSETCVNTGKDALERPPWRAFLPPPWVHVPHVDNYPYLYNHYYIFLKHVEIILKILFNSYFNHLLFIQIILFKQNNKK